jgi:HK97 gp10 family phage protein
MRNGIEIDGLDDLLKAFSKLPDDAIRKLSEPSTEGAAIVEERAKAKIHDVSGDLAKSLKVRKPGKSGKNKYKIFATVGFTKKGMHGVPLELGHRLVFFGHKTFRYVSEKPFLRPAADESKGEVATIMSDAMGKVIDEMGGRR